ncbi:uncharacterized protein ACO6RY_03110 [Pungitius sinensis]
MSANSSSSSPASVSSIFNLDSTASGVLLVVPPGVYVIYLGLKRRRPGTAASPFDVFTYHTVPVELINIAWSLLCSHSLLMS